MTPFPQRFLHPGGQRGLVGRYDDAVRQRSGTRVSLRGSPVAAPCERAALGERGKDRPTKFRLRRYATQETDDSGQGNLPLCQRLKRNAREDVAARARIQPNRAIQSPLTRRDVRTVAACALARPIEPSGASAHAATVHRSTCKTVKPTRHVSYYRATKRGGESEGSVPARHCAALAGRAHLVPEG